MALLDVERNLIVLRVVYDGPPEAGKTTSLRALAGSLGQELHSPAERDGRTLYFDWMDYTGGRFEGYQIRCQIVSVPGQAELAFRRHHLLREADVIVFVADSTEGRFDETVGVLAELPRVTSEVTPPPVGVIVQANKRDLADAIPMIDLRTRLRLHNLNMGVVESIASDGTGIRETFVFAVRLALDRVREQLRSRTLPVGSPEIDSAEQMLESIKGADARPRLDAGGPLAVPALNQVLAENDDTRQLAEVVPWRDSSPSSTPTTGGPLAPDAAAPSGAIWPPVEGRLILHEATSSPLAVQLLRSGSWSAKGVSGWRTYSAGDAIYADLELGREALIRWARLHVACSRLISASRCIVLAATGDGSWRLWQIARAERSLRDHLDDIASCATEEAAARILDVATVLSEMSAQLEDGPCHLRCSLDTIGRSDRGPVYIGLMPQDRGPLISSSRPIDLIGYELELVFRHSLRERRAEVMAVLARASRGNTPRGTAGVLDQLFKQSAAG